MEPLELLDDSSRKETRYLSLGIEVTPITHRDHAARVWSPRQGDQDVHVHMAGGVTSNSWGGCGLSLFCTLLSLFETRVGSR